MKQLPLVPEEPLAFEERTLQTSELPPVAGLWPDDAFIESVKAMGILEPLIVEKRGRGFVLLAGRRRLIAARKAGLETVPVRIVATGSVAGASITLAENLHRRTNPASEVEAIQELLKTAATWQEIAAATGLPVAKLAQRARLIEKLAPELLDAFKAGKLAPGPAWAATRLSKARQASLVKVLAKKGELSSADVRGARVKQKVAAMPAEIAFGVVLTGDPVGDVLSLVRGARQAAAPLSSEWTPALLCLEEAEGVLVRLRERMDERAKERANA